MRVNSPGKINLHLRVGPVRPDGFHPLVSWMTTVGLFDTLNFTLKSEAGVSLSCDAAGVPTDDRNLVVRAAKSLQQAAGVTGGVEIELVKRIPMGGGLGGGSGNAAVTLKTLNRLWDLNWSVDQLMPLAAALGSDAPFFLSDGSAWCFGRGEIVRPAPPPMPRWALLMLPAMSAGTPGVFRAFDALPAPDDWETPIDADDWASLSAGALLPRLRNDLEAPAFALYPQLAAWRASAEQSLGRVVRMSGSGSTLFTLYDTQDEAESQSGVVPESLPTVVASLCPLPV